MALSLAAAVPAFHAPLAAPRLSGVQMMAKSESLPFVDRPATLDAVSLIGDRGFDPLGFSDHTKGPFDTPEEHMAWMREAEIKHGRVCMLGTLGWIVVDLGMRAPGMPDVAGATNSYTAHDATVASGHLIVLMLACMVFEIAGAGGIAASLKGERVPGDFALTGGFGKTPAEMERLRLNEIEHCRLGMLAFSGIATQSAIAHGEVGFPYF